jgi:hypothetical protein
MGTDVPDLSTLAGARSGTVGATLRTRRQEIELQPLEAKTSGAATAYLKVEKPRFLFLEGSTGAVVAAAIATAALLDASVARRCLRGARRLFHRPPGGGRFRARPGRLFLCLLCGSRCGGRRIPPLRGACPRHFLLLPTTSTPRSPGKKVPAARTDDTPRPAVPDAPATEFSSLSCAPPAPAPVVAPRAEPLGLGAWAGRTARRPRSPSAKNGCQNRTGTLR